MDLISAISKNNTNAVLKLLSVGVNVDSCDDLDNITPLHYAVSSAKIEIIFLLLFCFLPQRLFPGIYILRNTSREIRLILPFSPRQLVPGNRKTFLFRKLTTRF